MLEAANNPQQIIDVVLPDTFIGFLRLLTYVYTNCLPDGSSDALLDDLLTADRYDFIDMRFYCESMLKPDPDNWVEIYIVASSISSTRLINDVNQFSIL
jgi:hypothetical protein